MRAVGELYRQHTRGSPQRALLEEPAGLAGVNAIAMLISYFGSGLADDRRGRTASFVFVPLIVALLALAHVARRKPHMDGSDPDP